jgi:hypothetical protein
MQRPSRVAIWFWTAPASLPEGPLVRLHVKRWGLLMATGGYLRWPFMGTFPGHQWLL